MKKVFRFLLCCSLFLSVFCLSNYLKQSTNHNEGKLESFMSSCFEYDEDGTPYLSTDFDNMTCYNSGKSTLSHVNNDDSLTSEALYYMYHYCV